MDTLESARLDNMEKTQEQYLEWFANVGANLARMDRRIEIMEAMLAEMHAERKARENGNAD